MTTLSAGARLGPYEVLGPIGSGGMGEVWRATDVILGRLAAVETRGVIVTAPSASPGYDFVSRFFAPQSGVPEDPVTGSAHCALAPYWCEKLGKTSLTGYQASARGGIVRVRIDGQRVRLAGQAVTVLRGELALDKMAS